MTEILELPELPEDDRVPDVKIGTTGIAAELDGEGCLCSDGALDLARKVILRDDFRHAAHDDIELLVEGWKQRSGHLA